MSHSHIKKPILHLDDTVELLIDELKDLESGSSIQVDSHAWEGKIKGYTMKDGTKFWFVKGKDGSTGFVQSNYLKLKSPKPERQ